MDPITRSDLQAFLHTLHQTSILTGAVRPAFTKVLEALTAAAYDDQVLSIAIAPDPLPDDDIPF